MVIYTHKFQRMPEYVSAIQFISDTCKWDELIKFCTPSNLTILWGENGFHGELETSRGVLKVSLHDWIVRSSKGEFYLCNPDMFQDTYLEVL